MEARFGHDFSRVRIHDDAPAHASAASLGALAYTVGNDIVFARDQSGPHDASARLLTHELAHVVQQRGVQRGSVPTVIGTQGDAAEREADDAARSDTESSLVRPLTVAQTPILQRQPTKGGKAAAPMITWDARTAIDAGVGDPTFVYYGNQNASGNKYVQTAQASGSVPTQSLYPYGQNCPSPCTKTPLQLHFLYYVDSDIVPRPQPFDDPNVVISLSYAPARTGPQAAARPVFSARSKATYAGPGHPLRTSFGTQVPFVPPEPGTLFVSLILDDPTSGEVATYSDAIPIVDCPVPPGQRAAPKGRMGELRTGTVIFVPDPAKAPLVYYRATGREGWSGRGIHADLMHDETGYFYYNESFKYYIAYPPT